MEKNHPLKKKIYILLYNISLLLRDTKAGKLVYDIFEELGIRIIISRFFNKLEVRNNYFHPNKQMEKSRFFFESNKERINTITGWLSDDISKQVYTSMIKFRQTSNYSDLPPNSMKEQYFDNNFFTYKNGEVFVDCGSYDGDSIRLFKKNMKKRDISQYTIIGFEPDAHNFKNLKRNYPTITVINAGVWSVDTELFFNSNQNITAANIVSGDQLLRVRSLDNCNEVQQATLIKMDIEGAEMDALIGAQNIIKTNKPKLAICIYHSDEDMLRLAEWIHNMVPEYKLYVRQHSNCICETVLYATL